MTDLIKRLRDAWRDAGESEASVYDRKGFPPIEIVNDPVADRQPAIDPAAIREAALQARIEELVRDQKQGGEDYCALMERYDALHVKLTKAVEDAEKWRYAFAAQSRKLQAVLYIEGVKAVLAELGGKVMTDLNSHEESLATDLAKAAAKLTECEAKLTKALEERDEYKAAAEICGKAARAMLAELEKTE